MKKNYAALNQTNYQEAVNRAQIANSAALAARTARNNRDNLYQILQDWSGIFTNSPIAILTFLFVFAVLMEIIFSFPMYMDLMSQMTGKGSIALALIGAFFIVAWGAYTSHLISKKWSRSVFNYSVYNKMKSSKKNMPEAAAEEEVRNDTMTDFIRGIILGFFLLIVVAAISWIRVWLLREITGTDFSLTHKLLPVVCVLIEIISGLYIAYLIRRMVTKYKARRLNKKYSTEKSHCVYETQMTHDFYQHAISNGEPIYYSNELMDALFRYERCSLDDDSYIEPIQKRKFLKVVVADDVGFVVGVKLAAKLCNGEYCNTISTDNQGEGILSWAGNANEVNVVYTDNEQHPGPFSENTTIRIDLKKPKQLPAAEQN